MLAGYVTSPDAVRLPMLLLGHPGAGKSLLTKVLAARLPASVYTVVQVPLRRVSANAPLINQVQEALDLATNRRVEWWQLAGQSTGTVRVVLLDGLDELLQASQQDRSGYLQEVMEFQRREADQQQPVVVIVTSRTVVADRVNIPPGTAIVKLDPFIDDDIADWLGRWNRINAAAITVGKVRELTVTAARRQPELAQQPLLLLMLACTQPIRICPHSRKTYRPQICTGDCWTGSPAARRPRTCHTARAPGNWSSRSRITWTGSPSRRWPCSIGDGRTSARRNSAPTSPPLMNG
jgi:hypothetical protein